MPAGIRPYLPPTFLLPYSYLTHTLLLPYSYLTHTFLLPYSYLTHTLLIPSFYHPHTLPPTLPVPSSYLTSYLPSTFLIPYLLPSFYLPHTLPVPSFYLPHTLPVPSSYLPSTLLIPYSYLTCTFLLPSSYLTCTFLIPYLYLPHTLPHTFLIPYLYPASCILLAVLGYSPRRLPVLACVQVAVLAGGWCCARWGTSLGGLPVLTCVQLAVHAGIRPSEAFLSLPCVLLAVSRWGCWVRWDTFLGGFLHPPHSPALRPPRLHFLQLCHLVIQSTRTTTFCRPNTHPRKCISRSTRWDMPLGGLPVLALCPTSSTSLGVVCTLGYIPRRPPRPCLRPASYIPLGGVVPAGIRPSEAFPIPTHAPALRPPRLHFLQLCHLVIPSTRTTPFCRPKKHPLKWSLGTPF